VPGSGLHPAGGGGGGAGGDDGGAGDSGSVATSDTSWSDGKQITADVTIPVGKTLTIDPSATITMAAGVTITVEGTLTASSSTAAHAKIIGNGWTGIVVATGGNLALDGVDITGPTTAIDVASGGIAKYDNATMTSAATPFNVQKGGKLQTTKAVVAGTRGITHIAGNFTASYLDYDSNGHEGITTTDAAATISIEDSSLHGLNMGDMIVAGPGAASVHVAYTEIKAVHCGFHFNDISAFDLSYLEVHQNADGAMLYGSSGAGPFRITHSNFETNTDFPYDTLGTNSPITIDDSYVTGTASDPGSVVSVTNPATQAWTDVGPRK
jgi:hypothetical protein